MKLKVKAFGLTCGILWGLGLFILTWWIMAFDGVSESVVIARVYRGYSISPLGSIIGLSYAFIDGWIGGIIFAWLYNLLASRASAKPKET